MSKLESVPDALPTVAVVKLAKRTQPPVQIGATIVLPAWMPERRVITQQWH